MGWTSYRATYYKNGKINRKAECDAYFLDGLNKGNYEILKSAMVGSTYYAAVKPLKKYGGKDENGNTIVLDIPKEEQYVFAVVFLTSIDTNNYHNFSYKDMDESVGPCQCDCPKGILDLLTATENKYANEWRNACRDNLKAKNNPNSLNKLPVGTILKVIMPFDTKYFRKGQEVKLCKCKKWNSNRTEWLTQTPPMCRFTASLMKALDGSYVIIKKGDVSYEKI